MIIQLKQIIKNYRNNVLSWESFVKITKKDWIDLLKSERLTIQLNGFDFLAHDGLIWIIYICLYRRYKELYTHIELPENEAQISFIKFVDISLLQKALNFSFTNPYLLDFVKEYNPHSQHAKALKNIRAVDRNNWANISFETTNHIKDYITQVFGFSLLGEDTFEKVNPFIKTLQEFLLNITLHGGNEPGNGVGLISTTLPPKNFDRIRYCFNDIGNGIKHSLIHNHSIKCNEDREAIYTALLFRYFNRHDDVVGIYPTLKFIQERAGAIGIRSGSAYISINFSNNRIKENFLKNFKNPSITWLKEISKYQMVEKIPGTQIYVDLHIPS